MELSQTCDRFLNFVAKNWSKSPFLGWEARSVPIFGGQINEMTNLIGLQLPKRF